MGRNALSRRRFSLGVVALAGIAGCADDGGESEAANETNDTDDEPVDDDQENDTDEDLGPDADEDGPGTLTVFLENEDGEPVSSGVEVTVDLEDDPLSYTDTAGIEDGEVEFAVDEEGEYTVIVESTEDAFEAVEEEVTIGEEDEELTVVLEGAPADEEDEGEEDEEE